MVREWRFAIGVQTPLGAGFQLDITPPPPLSTLGNCLDVCVFGRGASLSHASLNSGVNEYLVGQRWQFVRLVQCPEIAAGLYALHGVEMTHE